MNIGMLGLGQIGMLCLERLAEAEHSVVVYDQDGERMKQAASLGAEAVTSAAELAQRVEFTVVSLPDPPSVEAALMGERGLLNGSRPSTVVVDMSTVDPATSKNMALASQARQVSYLDSPVSGGEPRMTGVDAARAGTLTFMVGGDREAFERARPVFEVLGTRFHHLGPSGSGSTVKLLSNLLSGVHAAAAAEAFALGSALGFDRETLISVFQDTDAKSFFLTDYLWPRLKAEDYTAGFSVALQLKDHRLAGELAAKSGMSTPMNDAAITEFEGVVDSGGGRLDVTEIFRHASVRNTYNS